MALVRVEQLRAANYVSVLLSRECARVDLLQQRIAAMEMRISTQEQLIEQHVELQEVYVQEIEHWKQEALRKDKIIRREKLKAKVAIIGGIVIAILPVIL